MYSSLSKRISQIKKDKDRWRDAYENIAKRMSDSLDLNTRQITGLVSEMNQMTRRLSLIEERVSGNAKHIDALEARTGQNTADISSSSQKVHETRKDLIEFRNLIEGQVHDFRNLSDRVKKDITSMEITSAGMERFKKDMKAYIDDSLKSHEKSFDAMSRDSLDNIKERLKEHTTLEATVKERMAQVKESIRKEHEKIDENRNDIRKFKEHIISYMNDLLSTYENRFGMLKKDVEYSLERIGKK